jgi:hypothetical protein
MATFKTRLVGKVRQVAVEAAARGVHYLVEGTTAMAREVERLQTALAEQDGTLQSPLQTLEKRVEERLEALSPREPARPAVNPRVQATAELLLEEARDVEARIRGARPARHPLITVTAEPEARPAKTRSRAQGRKAAATTTAPKQATVSTSGAKEGFKAKRGQKHKQGHH